MKKRVDIILLNLLKKKIIQPLSVENVNRFLKLVYIEIYLCLQLVGSAPQFPHGSVDPIEEIAAVSLFLI